MKQEEIDQALAIEVVARFSHKTHGRNGQWNTLIKQTFIDGALWAFKLASTPKVNLVEVEKLLQARVDQLYGLDNTGERKGAVDYFRQLCNYTLSDLASEKEEGR